MHGGEDMFDQRKKIEQKYLTEKAFFFLRFEEFFFQMLIIS